MKILSLDSQLESLFWEYVYEDIPDYYFFIADMKNDKDNTKITLALNKRNHIDGMMLVYRDQIVQLRGSAEAVKALFAQQNLEKIELQIPEKYGRFLTPTGYEVKKTMELFLMTLQRGKETLRIKHDFVKLSTTDAEDIVTLMRVSDPD